MKKIILSIIFTMAAGLAFAHGGDTNSSGCHTNHKTGAYHCH